MFFFIYAFTIAKCVSLDCINNALNGKSGRQISVLIAYAFTCLCILFQK